MKAAVFYLNRHGEPVRRREMKASEAVALGVSNSRHVHVAGGASDREMTKTMKAAK